MPKPMKYPKGVWKTERPKMTDHRGRTWDVGDLTLPDGRVILAHLDTTWGWYFYFEVDGVWRKAKIDDFDASVGMSLKFDLRDREALKAFEAKLDAYETTVLNGTDEEVEAACVAIEEEAERIGFNEHGRLIAAHNLAERRNLAAQERA